MIWRWIEGHDPTVTPTAGGSFASPLIPRKGPAMHTRRLSIAVAVISMFGIAACGSGSISTSDLESDVSAQLAAEVGQTPESVSCPDELAAEVDAEVRCTLTAEDGTTIGLTVTVTSVDGDQALYDIIVDDEIQD